MTIVMTNIFVPIISQSLLSPSFNPHIGELLSPVLLCLRMKRAVLVVFYVVWGATLDLSLLSGFPPSSRREILGLIEERSPGSQSHQLQLH